MPVANYKIFCNNHNKFFYSYSQTKPTECPLTPTHVVGRVVELLNIFDNFNATNEPTGANDIREGYGLGSQWRDTVNDKTYFCVNNTEDAAVWELEITSASLPDVLGSFSGTVNASGIQTNAGAVTISNVAPSLGQILMASGNSNASWKNTLKYPIISKDKEIVVFSGTSGDIITGAGIRHYGALASNPSTPAPSAGDKYYNTVINHEMCYDTLRGKWLSVATLVEGCGSNVNRKTKQFYRRFNGMDTASTLGAYVPKGTIVGISMTTQTTAPHIFTVHVNSGGNILSFQSNISNPSYIKMDLNENFDSGIMSMENSNGPNSSTTTNLQATIFYKLRV